MVILALDTSTRTGSVAAVRDGNVLCEIANTSSDPYSTGLFRDLNALLRKLNLSLREIDLYAVAAGPGSFTGLRIGLTAAKAWAEAFNKPIAAVSGLEAIAAQAVPTLTAGREHMIAAVMDARQGQIYAGIFALTTDAARNGEQQRPAALQSICDEVVLRADEFVSYATDQRDSRLSDGEIVFASPTPEVIRPALEQSSLKSATVQPVSSVLAGIIGRLGAEKAARGELLDALHLDAHYVRRTDAEAKWSERHCDKR